MNIIKSIRNAMMTCDASVMKETMVSYWISPAFISVAPIQ